MIFLGHKFTVQSEGKLWKIYHCNICNILAYAVDSSYKLYKYSTGDELTISCHEQIIKNILE